jgi:hypothetical protein
LFLQCAAQGVKTRSRENENFISFVFSGLDFCSYEFHQVRPLLWGRFRNTGGENNPDKEND